LEVQGQKSRHFPKQKEHCISFTPALDLEPNETLLVALAGEAQADAVSPLSSKTYAPIGVPASLLSGRALEFSTLDQENP
jgi:hypothetical protein